MDWKSVLGKLAPTVANAIGGPLAGSVVSAIGEIFGISEPTQDKIKAAIEQGQMTGQQLADLRTLEMKLQAEERERGFRYSELEFKDKADARARDAGFQASGKHNYRADAMAFLAVLVIIGLVYAVWSTPDINEYVKGIVTFLLGRFTGYLDNIYNFEFGTTRSSQDKNSTIDKLAVGK